MLQTLDFTAIDVKASPEGRFSGYAAVFGIVDRQGDVIRPGAFEQFERTKSGHIRVLHSHDMRRPIGLAEVAQDSRGLKFDGQLLLDLPAAKEAHALMRSGLVDQMSVGFRVLPGGEAFDSKGVRVLSRLKLFEVSPVTFAANPEARIEHVKHIERPPQDIREFEGLLKSLGFSGRKAKLLAERGWLAAHPDHDDDEPNINLAELLPVKAALQSLTKQLTKGKPS